MSAGVPDGVGLDWLAAHFVEDHHWSTKSLIKEIVSSAAYRQSSDLRDALHQQSQSETLVSPLQYAKARENVKEFPVREPSAVLKPCSIKVFR